jgi:hypothetical protein
MKPTHKAPAIDKMLTAMTGISRTDAGERNICVLCRKPAVEFRDALSQKEYRISGMCQTCQDGVFDEDS